VRIRKLKLLNEIHTDFFVILQMSTAMSRTFSYAAIQTRCGTFLFRTGPIKIPPLSSRKIKKNLSSSARRILQEI